MTPGEDKDLRRQWEAIRRGWCLGSESFHARMKARLDGVIEPNIVASYDGPAVAERNRRTAEELLAAALHAVGLSGCDLSKLHKNDAQAGGGLAAAEAHYGEESLAERTVGHGARDSHIAIGPGRSKRRRW